ncbi:MAG: metallophosphoesterase family protein [Chloroflexota bacterium]
MQTLGVISDTHVPDKALALNPRALEIFRDAHVGAILHAGDISTPGVLKVLGKIAPVYAVKGNRDWLSMGHLPRERVLAFGDVTVGLAHGHGGFWRYFVGKARYLRYGYRLDDFLPQFIHHFKQMDVIVFGHSHRPVNEYRQGKLLFNPGAACCFEKLEKVYAPHVGLLYLDGNTARGELFPLEAK